MGENGEREKRRGKEEILWRSIVGAHPYKARVGHPQVQVTVHVQWRKAVGEEKESGYDG
jgi:hypothetical protein